MRWEQTSRHKSRGGRRRELYLWVVNECAPFTIGRQFAGGGVLETLDDGGFARAVVAHDKCQRSVELDRLPVLGPERPDALDGQLLDPRHGGWLLSATAVIRKAARAPLIQYRQIPRRGWRCGKDKAEYRKCSQVGRDGDWCTRLLDEAAELQTVRLDGGPLIGPRQRAEVLATTD